jgi:hypothetical protein
MRRPWYVEVRVRASPTKARPACPPAQGRRWRGRGAQRGTGRTSRILEAGRTHWRDNVVRLDQAVSSDRPSRIGPQHRHRQISPRRTVCTCAGRGGLRRRERGPRSMRCAARRAPETRRDGRTDGGSSTRRAVLFVWRVETSARGEQEYGCDANGKAPIGFRFLFEIITSTVGPRKSADDIFSFSSSDVSFFASTLSAYKYKMF